MGDNSKVYRVVIVPDGEIESPLIFLLIMNKTDIINTFKKYPMFASILVIIEGDREWGEAYLNDLVSKNFHGEMDLILHVRNH